MEFYPTHPFEEESVMYIKGNDKHCHWFERCPEYPKSNKRERYDSHAQIPPCELCRYCLMIELKENLHSLAVEV